MRNMPSQVVCGMRNGTGRPSMRAKACLQVATVVLVAACGPSSGADDVQPATPLSAARPTGTSTTVPLPGTEVASTEPSAATQPTSPPGIPEPTELPPIYGYGDFSEIPLLSVKYRDVAEAVARCLNDNGFAVELNEYGNGWRPPDGFPPAQLPLLLGTSQACEEGLRLPEPRPLSDAELWILYSWIVETSSCLESRGIEISEPPSFDTFSSEFESEAQWSPYREIPRLSGDALVELHSDCPAAVPTGYTPPSR